MKLSQSGEVLIGRDNTRSSHHPSTMQVIKRVQLGEACSAVCHHKGYTYVILRDIHRVDRIDQHGNVAIGLIQLTPLDNTAYEITAHENKIFILLRTLGNRFRFTASLKIYDLLGNDLPSFGLRSVDALTILGSHLVFADETNQRLSIHALAGTPVQHVKCQLTRQSLLSLCGCGDDAVIIADALGSKVFKIALATGAIEWTVDSVNMPFAPCLYGTDYILVTTSAKDDQTHIWMLDKVTGILNV